DARAGSTSFITGLVSDWLPFQSSRPSRTSWAPFSRGSLTCFGRRKSRSRRWSGSRTGRWTVSRDDFHARSAFAAVFPGLKKKKGSGLPRRKTRILFLLGGLYFP